jgi:NAD(P)H-nitrite reductase large subunit
MDKFVLIGQSAAVISAIKSLREAKPEASITLITCEAHLPYDRDLLPGLIAREIKEKDILIATDDVLKSLKVDVISGREITRVNPQRRRVFLEDRQQVEYDALIVADAPHVKFPSLKGVKRNGVFHVARLETVKSLIRFLPFAETIVVEPSGWAGVHTALSLKALGKDVIVAFAEDRILANILDAETSLQLQKLLELRGIRVLSANPVEDIIGDTELKAVRFKSGKVIAADMVVLGRVEPDLKFLAEGDLIVAERVPVSSAMRSSVTSIFAVDAACQMEDPKFIGDYSLSRAAIERQGQVAARVAAGEGAAYEAVADDIVGTMNRMFSVEEVHGSLTLQETETAPAMAMS